MNKNRGWEREWKKESTVPSNNLLGPNKGEEKKKEREKAPYSDHYLCGPVVMTSPNSHRGH